MSVTLRCGVTDETSRIGEPFETRRKPNAYVDDGRVSTVYVRAMLSRIVPRTLKVLET